MPSDESRWEQERALTQGWRLAQESKAGGGGTTRGCWKQKVELELSLRSLAILCSWLPISCGWTKLTRKCEPHTEK